MGGGWNAVTQARGEVGFFLYRADILLGVSDPLHLGEVWYGRAVTHRVLVLNLSVTQATVRQRRRPRAQFTQQTHTTFLTTRKYTWLCSALKWMIIHLVWGLDEKEPEKGKSPIISPKKTKVKVGLTETIKERLHVRRDWEGTWRRRWGGRSL